MDVVSGAENGQSRNSIFPGYAANIAMEPFLDVFPDHMNQATCDCETLVSVDTRIPNQVYPGLVSWDILSRPRSASLRAGSGGTVHG